MNQSPFDRLLADRRKRQGDRLFYVAVTSLMLVAIITGVVAEVVG